MSSLSLLPPHPSLSLFLAYQGFKDCCAPLEAVVGCLAHYCCGRAVIPDVVNRRAGDDPRPPDDDDASSDEDDVLNPDGTKKPKRKMRRKKR